MTAILRGNVFFSHDSHSNVSYIWKFSSVLPHKRSLVLMQRKSAATVKGISLSPPILSGRKGNNFIISGWRRGLFFCSRLSEKKKANFQRQRMGTMTRGQCSGVFVLCLQIAFIYPFDSCVNWWYNCFENRHIQQIESCSYEWVNGVGKNGYAEMQVGFKSVLGLLERLIREDTKN